MSDKYVERRKKQIQTSFDRQLARALMISNRRQTKIRSRKEFGNFLCDLVDLKDRNMSDLSVRYYNKETHLSIEKRQELEGQIRDLLNGFYVNSNPKYITYSLSEMQFTQKLSTLLSLGERAIEQVTKKYSPKTGRERYDGFTCWMCGEKVRERPHKYGLCADCFYGQYYEWNKETGRYELADVDTDDFPMWDGDAFVETLTEFEAKAISQNMHRMWKELVLPHLEEISEHRDDASYVEEAKSWGKVWDEYSAKNGIIMEMS